MKHQQKYGEEYIGVKLGRLTCIRKTDQKDGIGSFLWEFKCDCGKMTLTRMSRFIQGEVKSCGCLLKDGDPSKLHHWQEEMSSKYGTLPHQLLMDKQSNNTSGHKGITWDKANNKWRAYITLSGKSVRKRFAHIEDAIEWRKEMENSLHKPIIEQMIKEDLPNKTKKRLK